MEKWKLKILAKNYKVNLKIHWYKKHTCKLYQREVQKKNIFKKREINDIFMTLYDSLDKNLEEKHFWAISHLFTDGKRMPYNLYYIGVIEYIDVLNYISVCINHCYIIIDVLMYNFCIRYSNVVI